MNGPLGLEQGFTLPAAPPCRKAGGKGVVIELGGGGLDATVVAGGKAAVLRDASGSEVLRYADLYVVDAAGKELPAALMAEGGKLALRFEDGEAAYPVTVDPMMWVQQAELDASDGVPGDNFGNSVAVSGDTAVVGAWQKAMQKGAAYVFVLDGGSWFQQQELRADGGDPYDYFGDSVAVSGDTVVVGAYGKGAAYVFVVGDGGYLTQQAELRANDGAAGDLFGSSVALSGDTAIVGAPGYNAGSYQGAVYVFVLDGGSGFQQQELLADGGMPDDHFGSSVAVSGDIVVVGAPNAPMSNHGAAYVFVRDGGSWSQQTLLPEGGLNGNAEFGYSVAVSGNIVIVGAPYPSGQHPGAAYVFVLSDAGIFSLQEELMEEGGVSGDFFGSSVAVSGNIAVVGARGDAPCIDGGVCQGAAYVYVLSDAGTWSQQQPALIASHGVAGDIFGQSVAVSGDTVIVGAPGKNDDAGAAYVFFLSDAGPDGGTGGTGGGSSTSSTSGTGGTGGNPTVNLSCGCTVPGSAAPTRAAWLGATALLALCRRRRRKPRSFLSTRGAAAPPALQGGSR